MTNKGLIQKATQEKNNVGETKALKPVERLKAILYADSVQE